MLVCASKWFKAKSIALIVLIWYIGNPDDVHLEANFLNTAFYRGAPQQILAHKNRIF